MNRTTAIRWIITLFAILVLVVVGVVFLGQHLAEPEQPTTSLAVTNPIPLANHASQDAERSTVTAWEPRPASRLQGFRITFLQFNVLLR